MKENRPPQAVMLWESDFHKLVQIFTCMEEPTWPKLLDALEAAGSL